jgi:hypothetical protein
MSMMPATKRIASARVSSPLLRMLSASSVGLRAYGDAEPLTKGLTNPFNTAHFEAAASWRPLATID